MGRASNGYVSHQYVDHIKAGRIKEQSFGKIYAISRAIGRPLESRIREGAEVHPRL